VAALETFQRAGSAPERAKSVIAHHVTPEQAGEVFSRTRPKLPVYSHIVLPSATEQELIPPTRKTYSGPLGLGEDLMVIEVGETIQATSPAAVISTSETLAIARSQEREFDAPAGTDEGTVGALRLDVLALAAR